MERRNHARIACEFLKHILVTFSGKANGTGTLVQPFTGGCKIEAGTTPPLGASTPQPRHRSSHGRCDREERVVV